MYRQFRTNKRYLLDYHQKSLAFVFALNVLLAVFLGVDAKTLLIMAPGIFLVAQTNIWLVMSGLTYSAINCLLLGQASWQILLALPLALITAFAATSLIHNASHGNLRPKFLARPIAEFLGLLQLVGFPDWTIVHVMHHANADDEVKDPHPPKGLSFFKYLSGMRENILRVLVKEYLTLWGSTPESMQLLKRLGLVSKLEQIAKVTFWYQVLGAQWFTFFFAASIVAKMWHTAWHNYSTHKQVHGQKQILNLNHLGYRVINSLSFGFYYHKNHHDNPKLFDPRKMKENAQAKARTAA